MQHIGIVWKIPTAQAPFHVLATALSPLAVALGILASPIRSAQPPEMSRPKRSAQKFT